MKLAPPGILLLLLLLPPLLYPQTPFSQENATQLDRYLSVDIGPRPMGSPAEHRALEFAVSKFLEYGCDTAYVVPMTTASHANTTSGIAVGIRHGATKRMIVLGGHIDSAGPEIPGADDDGSGSATVMELARTLCQKPHHSTLVFCCFGGEEQGLEGSRHFVNTFSEIDSVDLMLQVDMANGLGILELDPDTHDGSAPPWLVRAAVEEFSKLGYHNLHYPTHFFSLNYAQSAAAGSDHESFLNCGIPAVDFTTDINKPIHTPRDNFENFDPAGLKRSGDLLYRLVERFDAGIPSRQIDHYWLYLLGAIPIIVPYWGIGLFVGSTILLSVAAFLAVRKRRDPPNSPDKVRWSGIKMFLFGLLIAACGWFSPDIVSLIRGVRHSWFTAVDAYYFLGFLGAAVGGWIALSLSRRSLPLTRCPYAFYKRSAIVLLLFIALLALASIKLMIEPAVTLLFISLAVIIRQPVIRLILLLLSPWWLLRLVFSEWAPLIFRSVAASPPMSVLGSIAMNAGVLIFFSVFLLPFYFGLAAVFNDSPSLQRFIPALRSVWALAAVLLVFVGWMSYLLAIPVYNGLWYRDVTVGETYIMEKGSRNILIRSGEYLTDLSLAHGGIDTTVNTRKTELSLTPAGYFDTTWLALARQETTQVDNEITHYSVTLTLNAKQRPYKVSLSYSNHGENLRAFDSPWNFNTGKKQTRLEWYSFPDTPLAIPVEFSVAGKDSVEEHLEVVFDSLAYPVRIDGEDIYVIPRTNYLANHTYKRGRQ